MQLYLNGSLHAQETILDRPSALETPVSAAQPNAFDLSVRSGKCDCSEDDAPFAKLERNHILKQVAIVLTGAAARTDFLARHHPTVL